MASNTGRMSLSVPSDKQAKLDTIAANAKRSRSYIVNEAIDHYLDLYEWQTRRIEKGCREPKAAMPDGRRMMRSLTGWKQRSVTGLHVASDEDHLAG